MILEIEPLDRDKPKWPSCVYREPVRGKQICTNSYAISSNGLKEPNEEIVRKIRSRKPSLREFGELLYSGLCKSCIYRQG